MTRELEGLDIKERYAVFFDICSSSTLLEDPILTNHVGAMRNLLIHLKKFLLGESETYGYEVYKFIGDGWILLFPDDTDGKGLIKFLETLSRTFQHRLYHSIVPKLESTPTILGLTFGIDKGPLVKLIMLQHTEYIGRALNVASRLQSAIKDKGSAPQYKILLSKHAFESLRLPAGFRRTEAVSRSLRNIRGGRNYECVKLKLRVGQRA